VLLLLNNERIYKKLVNKINELGFSEYDIGTLKADLSDLEEASDEYLEIIQQFLLADANNEDEILDVLIKLQLTMEHMFFHVNSGLPLLKKLIDKI
jgi:hypothetical protein